MLKNVFKLLEIEKKICTFLTQVHKSFNRIEPALKKSPDLHFLGINPQGCSRWALDRVVLNLPHIINDMLLI